MKSKNILGRICNIVFLVIMLLITCSSIYYAQNFSFNMVIGDSMYPTLIENDLLLIQKIDVDKLKDNDIVVVNVSNIKYFSDVTAENGGELYIIKRYIANKSTEDAIYVLGDNTDNSTDSRKIGLVQNENLYGKVVMNITQEQPKAADVILRLNHKK